MKILIVDIETAPNLAYVWSLWDENVPLDRLIDSGYILCWAAKWYGEDIVYYDSLHQSSKKQMLKSIHKLLDEADAVLHYNGIKFDIPHLNRGFLELGLKPPAPYKQIDLLNTAKRQFKFPSNKLDYVSKALGVGEKVRHKGFELWQGCMKDDPESWAVMEDYNTNDVVILENVYEKLKPWVKFHANHSLYNEENHVICPKCGSSKLHKRGFYYTLASKFQRYQCRECGSWAKDNKILNRKDFKTTEI